MTTIRSTAAAVKELLEYAGGVHEEPPARWRLAQAPVLWGIWWAILLLAILAFCGQTSKFIYIDF